MKHALKLLLCGAVGLLHQHAGALTDDEKKLELAFATLWLADWSQTAQIAKNPDRYHESWNRILPKHPTPNQVRAYFIGGLLAHYAVSSALSGTPYSKYWQGTTIAVQVITIKHNHGIGLKIGKEF